MAYTTIDDPSDYFNTVLYTGNNNTNVITGVGHQPDMIWVKKRNAEADHIIFDSVRGVTKGIFPSRNSAEETEGGNRGLRSFNTDGFTLGVEVNDMAGSCNDNNDTFVSWNWKAGTAFTNDASSTSVGSIDSAGSVNNDAGFSIVTYTGTGSNGTVKHGLNSVPKMFLVKELSNANSWEVYHASQGAGKNAQLNTTAAFESAGSSRWNSTAPTSATISIGTDSGVNRSSSNYIAYCFAEKQGYSKFGSYTGNGNADGPFVHLGFKPAWVFVKNTVDTDDWTIWDNKREDYAPGNPNESILVTNNSDAELDATARSVDFLSNGFKLRTNNTEINTTDEVYIYMAIAENPFVTSTGVPATAR